MEVGHQCILQMANKKNTYFEFTNIQIYIEYRKIERCTTGCVAAGYEPLCSKYQFKKCFHILKRPIQ